MVLPSVIHSIPTTVCFFLALYILLLGLKERSTLLFVLLLLSLSGYGVVQVLKQSRSDMADIDFLTRIATAIWGLVVPLSYHTLIGLLKEKQKTSGIILSCLYLGGFVIIGFSLTGQTIFKEYYLLVWGWEGITDFRNWFFWIFHFYLLCGVAAFGITLLVVQNQTANYRIQKLARTMLINYLWGAIFTVIPYCILSFFRVPMEILLDYFGAIAMTVIVLAIQKYQPEKISASQFFNNVASLMSTEMILVSPDRTILSINKDKLIYTGFSREEVEGQHYQKLFADNKAIERELNRASEETKCPELFKTNCNTQNGSQVELQLSVTGLFNTFHDIVAYLLAFNGIDRNSSAINHLQTTYDLSNREKEVADLLIKGLSNMEISDQLFISVNTVKTHSRNVYQKTETANRTELKAIVQKIESSRSA